MTQVAPQVEALRRIPKQPECNIGTSGHVDHGKCLSLDEYVLLNGRVTTGREILGSLQQQGELLKTTDGYAIYRLKSGKVVSMTGRLLPVEAESLFYVQDYRGSLYDVLTESGRSISVTPDHPLFASRSGYVGWTKASELREGDYVAFLSSVPSSNPPIFTDPLPSLRGEFSVVDYGQYASLQRMTDGFEDLSSLNASGLDQVRALKGLSVRRLARITHIRERDLQRLLTRGELASPRQLSKLREALRGDSPPVALAPGEFVAGTKRGRRNTMRLRDPVVDDDLMKWFAFVWAEGSSSRTRVAVAQTVQKDMLAEFLEITTRKFGVRFEQVSPVDYHLNSRALVALLEAKFSFRPGNESVCAIADWVLGLEESQRAVFLRWFLTLDGEFDHHSGQIMVSQRNEKNIVLLGYLLQSLGIVPRFSQTKHALKRGRRSYPRILISGRTNLRLFAQVVGFEDPMVQSRLVAYLGSIREASKESDFTMPISIEGLEMLVLKSGTIRGNFQRSAGSPAKRQGWYPAYSAFRTSGRIPRAKLVQVMSAVQARLETIQASLEALTNDEPDISSLMALIRLSQDTLAKESGMSRKRLSRILRRGDQSELGPLSQIVGRIAESTLLECRAVLEQYLLLANSPLIFDRIRSVGIEQYQGKIFDLSVPTYANFIAGTGAIVAHNTTLTQSITGVWASAHSEELKRGITIKVGYADAAFYRCPVTPPPANYSTSPICPVCGSETELLRCVSFVDCPGHESLMTNMLAGAAVMDGSVLVIAANEPVPRPQTREHLEALQMMGMKRIVVVQNKIDLVDNDAAAKNYEAIKAFVSGTVAADAPIVPISAQQNVNIDALIEAIEQTIPTPKRDANATPMMQVLRSFDVNKPGDDVASLVGGVLGGSLVRGVLHTGDELEILPGLPDERSGKFVPIVTKVESLGTGAGMAEEVSPGGLIAVGTLLDPTLTKGDQMVGSVIGKPGTLPPVWTHIEVDVQLFERAVGSLEQVKVERVKTGENLRLNIGTASVLCNATSVRDTVMEVDLRRPVSAEEGSRVAVSRRIAERWRLIGSGTIR